MPSPREINKNLIRQSESSNDKTLQLVHELITRLNTTDKTVPELYVMVLEGSNPDEFGTYKNIIMPLLTAIYHIEQCNEAMQLARRQI